MSMLYDPKYRAPVGYREPGGFTGSGYQQERERRPQYKVPYRQAI